MTLPRRRAAGSCKVAVSPGDSCTSCLGVSSGGLYCVVTTHFRPPLSSRLFPFPSLLFSWFSDLHLAWIVLSSIRTTDSFTAAHVIVDSDWREPVCDTLLSLREFFPWRLWRLAGPRRILSPFELRIFGAYLRDGVRLGRRSRIGGYTSALRCVR